MLSYIIPFFVEDLMKNHKQDLSKSIVDAQARSISTKAKRCHYHVSLAVDPLLLADICPAIANLLLNEFTPELRIIFANACFEIIKDEVKKDYMYPEHILVSIRLSNLPSFVPFATRFTFQSESNQLSIVRGTITLIEKPKHRVVQQLYLCENPKCRNQCELHASVKDRHFEIVKRSQVGKVLVCAKRQSVLPADLICCCGGIMAESHSDAVISTRKYGEMTLLKATGCFFNSK